MCGILPDFIELPIGTSTTISTPDYPFNYPDNTDCTWIINGAANGSYTDTPIYILEFQYFNTEEDYDFFSVGKGDVPGEDKVMYLSGEVTIVSLFVEGPMMWIRFTADDYSSRIGFEIQISSETETGETKRLNKAVNGFLIYLPMFNSIQFISIIKTLKNIDKRHHQNTKKHKQKT